MPPFWVPGAIFALVCFVGVWYDAFPTFPRLLGRFAKGAFFAPFSSVCGLEEFHE